MQLIKFGLVGLLGTFVHYLTLISAVSLFSISATLSSSVGFILGAFVNHHFNRRFTFDADKSYMTTLVHFMMSAGFLFFVNLVFMYVFVEKVAIHYLIAQVVTTGIVFVSGFMINKYLLFKS